MSRAFQLQGQVPRILTPTEAARGGITRATTRHAVRTGRWAPLLDGIVLTSPGPIVRLDWARAGLHVAGAGSALSGWDAVRAFGLGALTPPDDLVLLLCRGGEHRERGGVRFRPTARSYGPASTYRLPIAYGGIPVVTAARAIADSALLYDTLAPVRALVTSAIQRQVCTPEQLGDVLATSPRNYSAQFRAALSDVLDGAHSIAEAEASEALAAGLVPAFELNVPIVASGGRIVARADVLWRRLRAVLEIDSRQFHFDEDGWDATRTRHNRLTSAGLAVQHYSPSEVRAAPARWALEVGAWLAARATELQVPLGPPGGPIRHGPGGPPPFLLP